MYLLFDDFTRNNFCSLRTDHFLHVGVPHSVGSTHMVLGSWRKTKQAHLNYSTKYASVSKKETKEPETTRKNVFVLKPLTKDGEELLYALLLW